MRAIAAIVSSANMIFPKQEAPWQVLAVGFGGLGFGLNLAGDISLSYTMDCYHDVSSA